LGDEGAGDDDSISAAVNWSIDHGADIINMSLGADAQYERYFPKTKAIIRLAVSKGIAVICAAGNENADRVGFPAMMGETIAVAAIDTRQQRANFSNRGPRLDFAAAGVDVLSTYKNGTYAKLSGTSFSAPYLSGMAALILSDHRNREGDTPINHPEDLREHIRKISMDLGPDGFDTDYGYGKPIFGKINTEEPMEPPPKEVKTAWWEKFLQAIGL